MFLSFESLVLHFLLIFFSSLQLLCISTFCYRHVHLKYLFVSIRIILTSTQGQVFGEQICIIAENVICILTQFWKLHITWWIEYIWLWIWFQRSIIPTASSYTSPVKWFWINIKNWHTYTCSAHSISHTYVNSHNTVLQPILREKLCMMYVHTKYPSSKIEKFTQ